MMETVKPQSWFDSVKSFLTQRYYSKSSDINQVEFTDEKKKAFLLASEEIKIINETEKSVSEALLAFHTSLAIFQGKRKTILEEKKKLIQQLHEYDEESKNSSQAQESNISPITTRNDEPQLHTSPSLDSARHTFTELDTSSDAILKEKNEEDHEKEEQESLQAYVPPPNDPNAKARQMLFNSLYSDIPNLLKKIDAKIDDYVVKIFDLDTKKKEIVQKRREVEKILYKSQHVSEEDEVIEAPITTFEPNQIPVQMDALEEGVHIPLKEINHDDDDD